MFIHRESVPSSMRDSQHSRLPEYLPVNVLQSTMLPGMVEPAWLVWVPNLATSIVVPNSPPDLSSANSQELPWLKQNVVAASHDSTAAAAKYSTGAWKNESS